MCEPTTIMTAVAVASSSLQVVSQFQQARAQASSLEQQAQAAEEESAAAAGHQMSERLREARAVAARRAVAAGEGGVGGQSVAAGVAQALGSGNQDLGVIRKQAAFQTRANAARFRAEAAQIQRPNALSSGLQIAQSGMAGYDLGGRIDTAYQSLRIGGRS